MIIDCNDLFLKLTSENEADLHQLSCSSDKLTDNHIAHSFNKNELCVRIYSKMPAIKFEWETIAYNPLQGITYRAKVLGGWLVRTAICINQYGGSSVEESNLIFIPDPNHEWEIEK